MCWRHHCPFRTRGVAEEEAIGENIINLLIIGVTGMTGGALLDATLGCAWFKVSGLTRTWDGPIYTQLEARGVKLVTGDMSHPHTLAHAMHDIDTVFLVTNYWEHRSVEVEYYQGVNVVNVAIEQEVKHLIYVGTDYSSGKAHERCKYLEGKSLVENYIISVGIPFTILNLGFYYENLLSVFKPNQLGPSEYGLALPMGRIPLNCGSVYDFGCCIGRLALQRKSFLFRTVKLATAYLTVADIARRLNAFLPSFRFIVPKFTVDEYNTLELSEARDLAGMFTHFHHVMEWDRSETVRLYPAWRSLDEWINDNGKAFIELLTEKSLVSHGLGQICSAWTTLASSHYSGRANTDQRSFSRIAQISRIGERLRQWLPSMMGGIPYPGFMDRPRTESSMTNENLDTFAKLESIEHGRNTSI